MEEKKKIAIVGFSFALAEIEPNICNISLAEEIKRIAEIKRLQGYEVCIVSQWEISEALKNTVNFKPNLTVYKDGEKYLSSDYVVNKSLIYAQERNIKDIIIIANPFIHLFFCRRLFKKSGFNVLKEKIKWIGFYKKSIQWWTRGPIRLLVYIILIVLFGRRGH